LAGNFNNTIPGSQGRSVSSGVIGLTCDKIINTNGDAMSGSYSNLNMRIYWDGDLLDEILNSAGGEGRPAAIFKWGGSRIWTSEGAVHNNSSKCNPSAQGDILGDWREEVVLRTSSNDALRIFCTTYTTNFGIYTLWHDHVYRNGMAWQCVGYNQPPQTSFFLGELEGITVAPPPLMLRGRTEVQNGGTIQTTSDHLLVSGYEDKTISVAADAAPRILTVNAPAWVKGSGSKQATASTPKSPARTTINYTTTLTGGAFSGVTRLVKQGEGTLVLPNVVEKHTGNTDVWNGTLCFDGTMQSSPVWMNRHTTLISEGGQFLAGLKLDYNSTTYPGGKDKVGSITASELTLGFGSRIVFDVESTTSIDQVNATKLIIDTKDWEFGPKYKTPVFQFVNASRLTAGKYLLGNVGQVSGSVGDILVEGISDIRFCLTHEEGKLYLVLEELRNPASVVWNGTDDNNLWDLAVTKNFLNAGQADFAVVGDDILFDDNAATGNVTIKGAVAPKSITFNNSTLAYTLTGDSILGGGPIVKNGTANVTINTENRTGATTINAGKLIVNSLANNTGITYGALGNVSQTITINDGAVLGISQPVITDQPFNVNGTATIEVASGLSFTLNKGLKGTDAVVNKTGAGTMTTGVNNTYKKLIVSAGRVNFVQQNGVDQAPDTVELRNGIVWGANMEDTPGITNKANFVVPSGKTGTFYSSFRGAYSGKLSGAGTFNVYSGGVRCYWRGDWSQFTGKVVVGKSNRQNKQAYQPSFDFDNSYGLPNATLSVNEGVLCSNNGKDFVLGKVEGKGTLVGSGNWILGADNSNFTLATEVGITSDRTDDYGGTISKSPSKLTKRGTGKMMIMSMGNLNAVLTIEQGTLVFNESKLATLVAGTNLTTVKNGGRIVAQGLFYNLTMESGAELIPCGSLTNETTPGTIKTNLVTRINEGATVNFLIGSAKQSTLQMGTMLAMNGTVKLTLLNGYTPKVGDSFTLWTVNGTFSGTPSYDLPALPDGLYWDVSGVAQKTGVITITNEPSGIGNIAAAAQVDCKVYDLSGVQVAAFQSTKGNMPAEARRQGLVTGTYIVRMNDGYRSETCKLVVRQ
jgi:autotransporter-associated beta strand protein